MSDEAEISNGQYSDYEDLKMWRIARAYYADMGWQDLQASVDQQVARILEKKERLDGSVPGYPSES